MSEIADMDMETRNRIEPNVSKIAVLRANALGDLIFTLPALKALRAAYPAAEIYLLGLDWHAAFLEGRTGPIDRVVVIPPYRGLSLRPDAPDDPIRIERFFNRMRTEHFDVAVQLHGGGDFSNPFTRRLGARLTVGLKSPDAPPLDRWSPYVYYQPEVLRALEVVSLVGATPVTVEPRLAVTAADLTEAATIVPDDGAPLVVLHPGAGDPRRRWPAASFVAVGDALAADGARIVLTGTEPERDLIAAIAASMQAPALDTAGRLSLSGMAGLLSRAALVVSNDTGPLHLAAAVGAATVGIFWCGNLITAGPTSRARHRPLLSWRLACPVCGRDCTKVNCGHRPSFVADVPVGEVLAAARDLLHAERRLAVA